MACHKLIHLPTYCILSSNGWPSLTPNNRHTITPSPVSCLPCLSNLSQICPGCQLPTCQQQAISFKFTPRWCAPNNCNDLLIWSITPLSSNTNVDTIRVLRGPPMTLTLMWLCTNDSLLTHVKHHWVGPCDSTSLMPDSEAGDPASHPSHTTQCDHHCPQPPFQTGLVDNFNRRILII